MRKTRLVLGAMIWGVTVNAALAQIPADGVAPGCDNGCTSCSKSCDSAGSEHHTIKRLLAWISYRPLCAKGNCCHSYCCHPPTYALFPCPPHVACPCDASCGQPGAVVGPAPVAANAAPPAMGPVLQTAHFTKAGGASVVEPVQPRQPFTTYDPKKITATMPALAPAPFRKPVLPTEGCDRK